MTNMRKITAFVPADVLEYAQGYTGEGVSETLRTALRELAHRRALQELKALRGAVQHNPDLPDRDEDRDLDQFIEPQ